MGYQLTYISILILLERLFPRKPMSFQFKSTFWFVTNFIILGSLIPKFTLGLRQFLNLDAVGFSMDLRGYGLVFQFLIFFVLTDFLYFLTHALFHKSDFFWKFHSVHHSSQNLDALASFKHSWVDAFINIGLSYILSQFFRVEASVVVLVNMSFLYVCVFQHANINFEKVKTPLLKRIFITPAMHRKHHELTDSKRSYNRGFVFSIWDQIFGSFSEVDVEQDKFGINTPGYPHNSNLKQFFYPILSSDRTRREG